MARVTSRSNNRCYFVYILSSLSGTLYVGVTDDLRRRTAEHKQGCVDGFTKRYHVNRLMYFETFRDPAAASRREKQLKKFRREKKVALFAASNPHWKDLGEELFSLRNKESIRLQFL
jgi:putative endonuclease